MTATLLTFPVFRAFDSNGAPLAGGLLYSYQAGTTTPLATYVDQAGVTQNTNPVVLDSTGTANVWLGDSTYKLVLKDKDGVQQWSVDNIQSEGNQISSAVAGIYSAFANTSDVAKGDALVGVKQPFNGSVSRTQHEKNQDFVSVLDFGADPTGTDDSTSAFAAAQEASTCVFIPPGTYLLQDFQHGVDVTWKGAGKDSVYLKQGDKDKYIWKMVCNASQPIHLRGISLTGVTLKGATDSAASGLYMEVIDGNYAIQDATIDIRADECFHSLEMVCVDPALAIYDCQIKVTQGSSLDTGCILKGVYNNYWMHIAGAANGISFIDSGWNSVYLQAVSEGRQRISGANCVVLNPTIESWVGDAQDDAMSYIGTNMTIIGANIINVPSTKAPVGLALNGSSGSYQILGFSVIGTDHPTYPIGIHSGNSGVISNATVSGGYRLELYVPADAMAAFTFIGDCSSITHYKGASQFTPSGGSVASATSIDPTGLTFHVTGTSAIQTITLPSSDFIGSITIIPDEVFTTATGGNIAKASTAVVGKALVMTYDGTSWYPSY